MNDTIYRQEAIEALADYIHNVDKVYSTGKLSTDDCKDAAKSVLDDLPSAQPEIIRCKDCKHYHADVFGSELKLPSIYDHIIVAHHGCKRWSQDENDMKCVKPDGYCFLAERREE